MSYIYRQGTPESCEFIVGAQGEPNGGPKVILCDAPARIKRNGRWFCADHFDQVEDDNGEKPTIVRDGTSTSIIF